MVHIKKNKIIKIVLGSSTLCTIFFIILLIPVLMVMDFFGSNVTDGYVENNEEYASDYLTVANKNIKANNGYVSLERILYFYNADSDLTFDEIYTDNLDPDSKKMLPISEVCALDKYKYLDECSTDSIASSGQVNEEQSKPFAPPIDFTSSTLTSFFMQERVIYGKANIHKAWDIANSQQTPVYSVCDGTVETVSFPYSTNSIDTNDTQGGNIIKLTCEVDDLTYTILYGHLYPNSTTLSAGDTVTKGQQIATVGTTGYSTGNHLHYQVSLNGSVIDGMSLIDFTYELEEGQTPYKPLTPVNPNETLPSYQN